MVLALVCALVANLSYGFGTVLQATGARRASTAQHLDVMLFARLSRQLPYLAGLALDAVGFVASIVALRTLPLFVVQAAIAGSIGVTALTSVFVFGFRLRRSDLVAIAPEVTGPIIGLYVVDNQTIKRGDKLYKIDPVPFQLEVNQRQAQIEEQTAQLKVAHEELAASKAALESSTSAHTYAVEQQARYAVLAAEQSAPRAELDRWNNELRRSAADMTISQLAIAKSQSSISAHQAALELAKADKAYAEWKLSRTDVNSPTDGWINNLTVRIGDTATVNLPNIGIVDAHAWRVIANYKEYYIRPLHIGDTAWVWLDSEPWKFHRARITGIARGFSRNPQAPMLLPYVAPTTDWIRLERRIPVTIVFEELPVDGKLYMGADARVVIFPR